LAWVPIAGKHRLQLLANASGRELDSVTFQVRGHAPAH
jgi:hypothetical protein